MAAAAVPVLVPPVHANGALNQLTPNVIGYADADVGRSYKRVRYTEMANAAGDATDAELGHELVFHLDVLQHNANAVAAPIWARRLQESLENKFDNLENKFDNLKSKFDNLDIGARRLEAKFDNLQIMRVNESNSRCTPQLLLRLKFVTAGNSSVDIGQVPTPLNLQGVNMDHLQTRQTLNQLTGNEINVLHDVYQDPSFSSVISSVAQRRAAFTTFLIGY
jgi:hypothetical protein